MEMLSKLRLRIIKYLDTLEYICIIFKNTKSVILPYNFSILIKNRLMLSCVYLLINSSFKITFNIRNSHTIAGCRTAANGHSAANSAARQPTASPGKWVYHLFTIPTKISKNESYKCLHFLKMDGYIILLYNFNFLLIEQLTNT